MSAADKRSESTRAGGPEVTRGAEVAQDTMPPFDPAALPEAGPGEASVEAGLDGFYRPTALFDEGEFLGELADVVGQAGDTRAAIQAEQPPQGCRLIVVAGPDLGKQWSFKAQELVIGRDEDCDLPLADIAVSRAHARIRFEGESFSVEDLGSGNGCFVNGVKVQHQPLHPGDELRIGDRTLRFVELSEAPPTDAAQPRYEDPEADDEGAAEPSEEASVAAVEAATGVAPQAEAPGDALEGESDGETRGGLERGLDGAVPPGKALGAVLRYGGLALALVLLLGLGAWVYRRYLSGPTPGEQAQEARRAFLQGVELVKRRRFGDAELVLQRALVLRPGYDRAAQYLAHARTQRAHHDALLAAQAQAAAGQPQAALDQLAGLADSAYAAEAAKARRSIRSQQAQARIAAARAQLKAGDRDGAKAQLDEAQALAPWMQLSALRRQLKAAPQPRRARGARRSARTPPALRPALAQYRRGELDAAIATAGGVKGEAAAALSSQLQRLRRLQAEANRALKAKDGGAVVAAAEPAWALDRRLAGRKRSPLGRALRPVYARGLYLRAIEQRSQGAHAAALSDLRRALKIEPHNPLAAPALAAMERQLRDQCLEAEARATADPAAARAIFTRVARRTPRRHPLHRRAQRWLAAHR